VADSKSINQHLWGGITNRVFHSLSVLFYELVLGLLLFFFPVPSSLATEKAVTLKRPNILLIAIDDLNDWVGCLGGHPQAATPNIDRLANGGTLFTNAHCQAPVCQPSRASLMTSTYPSSSGLYFLVPGIADSPIIKNKKTLPERFAEEGYRVLGAGKLFHVINGPAFNKFGKYGGGFGYFGPQPAQKISQPHGHPLWDWGSFPAATGQMPDMQIANWAVNQLKEMDQTPFFLAVGFYRPHVPMLVPQEWFNRHPRNNIRLPVILANDVEDLSPYARDLTSLQHVAPLHDWIIENKQWEHAVQSYLACCSFVDACVGKVLDALERSPHRNNTVIVLFSDHGFHLGEKKRWAKRSLWEDGTHIPLIISGAGLPKDQICQQPVGLIDLYPTLLDICHFQSDASHEGQSLKPQLIYPLQARVPARTTFGPGNHAIRSRDWRYIHYRDGSEELYDHRNDPHEWHNLATNPKWRTVLEEHRQHLPEKEHRILGTGSTGHLAFTAAENQRASRTINK
jgi:arylsulfatase A-like enzyme